MLYRRLRHSHDDVTAKTAKHLDFEEHGHQTPHASINDAMPTTKPRASFFRFLFPAVMDLLSTTLGYVGLVKGSSSVYQMLRSSVVVFTGRGESGVHGGDTCSDHFRRLAEAPAGSAALCRHRAGDVRHYHRGVELAARRWRQRRADAAARCRRVHRRGASAHRNPVQLRGEVDGSEAPEAVQCLIRGRTSRSTLSGWWGVRAFGGSACSLSV